jgi:hypothetical protein
VSFDEFSLDADIYYKGALIEMPFQSPDMAKVLEKGL